MACLLFGVRSLLLLQVMMMTTLLLVNSTIKSQSTLSSNREPAGRIEPILEQIVDQQRHQLDVTSNLTAFLHSRIERCEMTAHSARGEPIRPVIIL